MTIHGPKFRSVELPRDQELAIRFRRETYVISYGHDREFDSDAYVAKLRQRLLENSRSCVFLWSGGLVVGQLELSSDFIHFAYLAPEARGTGYGDLLMAYAESYFRTQGVTSARLAVSSSNLRAIQFYQAHGWVDLGPHPTRPLDRLMEIRYPNSPRPAGSLSAWQDE